MAGQATRKVRLQKRAGSSGSYTWSDVAQVTDIEIGAKSKSLETTDLLSDAVENVAALPDNGTAKLSLNFNPAAATHTALDADQAAGTTATYRIFIPTPPLVTSGSQAGYTKEFTAYPEEVTYKIKTGDKITADVGLKISGAVSAWTSGSITLS